MAIELPIDINKVKGFLDPLEGEALYSYAKKYTKEGDALEIGSYCGKSAVYIGSAVKENNQKLYSIDHHKGSEEQQPGEEFFDPDLLNKEGNGINTLPYFLNTINSSKLKKIVIPVISSSEDDTAAGPTTATWFRGLSCNRRKRSGYRDSNPHKPPKWTFIRL